MEKTFRTDWSGVNESGYLHKKGRKCHKLILLAVMVKIFSLSKAKENMTFKKNHFYSKHEHF